MPREAYVNGRYLPHGAAQVHIEDRGYQFADGVYEVVAVIDGVLVDEEPHLDRLERSLDELRMAMPTSRQALKMISRELLRRNAVTHGFVYLQVTRGVAPRDHKFPQAVRPALVLTTRQTKPTPPEKVSEGVSVITTHDIRWKRRDIKSISLLPNIMAKQDAIEAGSYEAWMVDDDGFVTEGSSTNAWIVTKDGHLVTRNASNSILNGITRLTVLEIARQHGVTFQERPFTVDEAAEAREAFLTSSSNFVMPVVRIDDKSVANGHPGILTMKLREGFMAYVQTLGSEA